MNSRRESHDCAIVDGDDDVVPGIAQKFRECPRIHRIVEDIRSDGGKKVVIAGLENPDFHWRNSGTLRPMRETKMRRDISSDVGARAPIAKGRWRASPRPGHPLST